MNDVETALEQLRDLHPPPVPGLWPLAPGWWILILVVLAGVTWAAWLLWRRHRRSLWRRGVLSSLDELEQSPRAQADPMWLVAEVSVLLRRVALIAHGRDEVATLSGESWLVFLDRTGGDAQFTQGAGRVLATGPYARHEKFDCEGLMSVCRRWLEHNLRVMDPSRIGRRFSGSCP